MKRKPVNLYEQVLPFDFWEEEKNKEREKINNLPYFSKPKDDQEKLFNLQKEYFKGNESALNQIFMLLLKIAPRVVNIEMNNSNRYFPQETIDEMSLDSVSIFIKQIKENRLIIKTSFLAYLRLQVLKIMNNQTKAQKLEKYCIENNIQIFSLREEEKLAIKKLFEIEEREKYDNRKID